MLDSRSQLRLSVQGQGSQGTGAGCNDCEGHNPRWQRAQVPCTFDCCQLAHYPRSKLRGSPSLRHAGCADVSGCTPHLEGQAGLSQVPVHLEELGQQAVDLGAQGVRGQRRGRGCSSLDGGCCSGRLAG